MDGHPSGFHSKSKAWTRFLPIRRKHSAQPTICRVTIYQSGPGGHGVRALCQSECSHSDMENLSDYVQRSFLTGHYWNGATYHAQYVPIPLSRTIAQSTSSVRIHHFQCLNRSHCGRTFVPATMTIYSPRSSAVIPSTACVAAAS